MEKFRSQSGQVLMIVVLTMIVSLTVGLSIASRTITNLKISKQSEESQRAFQAAEAGVERALKSGESITSPLDLGNQSNFTTDVKSAQGAAILLNGNNEVDQDRGLDVWLSNYPNYSSPKNYSNLNIYWGSSGQDRCITPTNDSEKAKVSPALEVVVLSGNLSSPTFVKYVYDYCTSGRLPGASTSVNLGGSLTDSNTASSDNFRYWITLPAITSGLIMKVIPIYNSTIIGVESRTQNFPLQGKTVTSTGQSGDTVRKIVYFQAFPQIPVEIFPYSIISQN